MTQVEEDIAWVEAPKDYALGLRNGKLVCKNPKGKVLATVPKWLKKEDVADRLLALSQWLQEHRLECRHTVERWMLRSLAIPREILEEVWADPDWRDMLENMVIAPTDDAGKVDHDREGLLRAVDREHGFGIVDLDGETQWLDEPTVMFLHPILIGALEELRELAGDLGVEQEIDQLYRPVFSPSEEQRESTAIHDYSNGRFQQLNHVLSLCRQLGYPVRGGCATCRIWEAGSVTEARYFVGDESPDFETETGELVFVDSEQRPVRIDRVGPVSFSEGVLMASSLYARRQVQSEEEDE